MKSQPEQLSEEAFAAQVREREKEARSRYEAHRRTWGEGVPHFSEGTFEFWQRLAEGQFHIGRCTQCSHTYFPPRVICPNCWAADAVELIASKGTGRIFSYTVAHRVANSLQSLAPLLMVCIDLDEGVRMFTWLRGAQGDAQLVGKRCRVSIETILGRIRFVARLAE